MNISQLPLVSILCPIYNVEPFVKKCAESLFSQTYANLEFVFVDDKCTDNSIAIIQNTLEKYPERKSNVQILKHAENLGQAAGRNTALSAFKGDFLMFVDADDWIEPNSVELLVNKQLETNADIVYGQMMAHTKDSDELWIEPNYSSKIEMIIHVSKLTIDHSLCKRLYRKSLFVDNHLGCVNGWDYGEDHYLLPQLYWFAHRIERIENIIYHYNYWKEGYVKHKLQTIWKMWSNELNVIDALLLFFEDKNDRCVDSLKYTKVEYLKNCLGQAYGHHTRKKYNEIAYMLYSMPEPYRSSARFNSADERILYRFYETRRCYRAIVKILIGLYKKLGIDC